MKTFYFCNFCDFYVKKKNKTNVAEANFCKLHIMKRLEIFKNLLTIT